MTRCSSCGFDLADEDFIFSKGICIFCDPNYLPNFKKKEDNVLIQLLEEEETVKQYISLGHSEKLKVWYYGFKLKGKNAILTSNHEIKRDNLEHFKEKEIGINEIKEIIDYVGDIGDIAPTITKETTKKFYTINSRNNIVNIKKLYENIRNKILYYMDFAGQDEIADVLTCWILATYIFTLFEWFPHILFNAPSGSGKSKCAKIVMNLSFNGYDLGASAGVTPAQIFRTLEDNRGTILIDEFEQVDSDTQKLINQILNASCEKNAYIIRSEQIEKKWTSKKFPIFCPKICCNISGINPTSLSRIIAFKWLKTISDKGKRKPERDKKSFDDLRQECYIFGLENWEQIKSIYETIEIESLNNRDSDNWLPLFSIARFIDNSEGLEVKVEEQLLKYVQNYKDVEIETEDITEEFFRLLYESLSEESQYYTPKAISQLNGISELLNYLKSPAHWIGKKLRLYKFSTNRGGGFRKYLLSKNSVNKILETYYTNIIPHNDITTHNNTNNTQQH